jgi:hypothetical protein
MVCWKVPRDKIHLENLRIAKGPTIPLWDVWTFAFLVDLEYMYPLF